MAEVMSLGALAASLAQTFPDEIKPTFNRMSNLVALVRIVRGAGKNCAWEVDTDGAMAEGFVEGAPVVNFANDQPVPIILPWGLYRSNFRVTNTAAAVAATSHSPAQIKDLMGRGFFGSMGKLASTINQAGYMGGAGVLAPGAPPPIFGLSSVAIRDDNAYGGVDRVPPANLYWRAIVRDGGAARPTIQLIRSVLAAIYRASGRRPDIALVDSDMLNAIKALYDDKRTYTRDVMTAARGRVTLDNTADVVVVEGCQFIEDKDAPAGEILFINSGEIEIEVLPQVQNFADPLGPANDGFNTLMLGFHAYELGRVGSDRRVSVEAHLQLKILRPNSCGKITNLLAA
jgi:hypothetical protein